MKPIFVVTVASESLDLITFCVDLIWKAYPGGSVVIVADQPRTDLAAVPAKFVQRPKPLKVQPEGGNWWHSFFEEALRETGDIIFKFDPDARISRKLSYIPDVDCFGSLLGKGEVQEHIQGGCQAFWRTSAQKLYDSKVFTFPALTDWKTWAFKRDYDYDWAEWKGYLSTDRIIMWGLRACGMSWGNHAEIISLCKHDWLPADLTPWAITHPHKVPGVVKACEAKPN